MQLTVDGRAVFATTGGRPFDPDDRVVVFIHGAGMDRTVWALQARYFAHHGCSVMAVDLPGHGKSEGPPLESIAEMADWLSRLLDTAGVEAATLVGHSMGALAALECAARHPSRVTALALLGAAADMPVHPDLLAAAGADDPRAVEMVASWSHARHLGGSPTHGAWLLGGTERLLESAGPGVLYTGLSACAAYSGGAAAGAVACPVLVVVGEEDRMTRPAAGAALADKAGAAITVIPGAGHAMMVERPDETIRALEVIL